jgi:hypothetical protein
MAGARVAGAMFIGDDRHGIYDIRFTIYAPLENFNGTRESQIVNRK